MTETRCRQIVAFRSHRVCEGCCRQVATEMSHRRARSQGGLWIPSNIQHLCHDCHHWVEMNPTAAHEVGWRLWAGEEPELTPVLMNGRRRVLFSSIYTEAAA